MKNYFPYKLTIVILVTSYTNADLDGTACAYAYAEFLRKQGEEAEAGIFGKMHQEARFVIEEIGAEVKKGEDLIANADKVILTDDSRLEGLPDTVEPEKVVEIIDHREIEEIEEFPNASIQIEKVGAAATLVSEKFWSKNTEISEEAAVLLYGGIKSNTMNFNAKTTTNRDKKMAEWLEKQAEIPENLTRRMFDHKSNVGKPLKETFLGDFKVVEAKGKNIGIAQLEIIGVENFLEKNKLEIEEALEQIDTEKELDHLYLTCADIEKGFTLLCSTVPETKELISKSLDVNFDGNVARKDRLMLRKEINPKLCENL